MTLNARRRLHRISSLAAIFFLMLFAVSGILLNHPDGIAGADISRRALPPFYRFERWNQGLLRGEISLPGHSGRILFGNSGMWLADNKVSDFNEGLPAPIAKRNVRAMALTPEGKLLSLTTRSLWLKESFHTPWREVKLDYGAPLSDMTLRGDTLLVATRDALLIASTRDMRFRKLTLPAPAGADISRPTLFRHVWLLHSGKLFGIPGNVVADLTALILLLLCLTGVYLWLFPKSLKRFKSLRSHALRLGIIRRHSSRIHIKAGVVTLVVTLLITFTGWMLRPPFLIALAQTRAPAVKGTTLYDTNPWKDKLRMIRYDAATGRWLLSTSEGFFSMSGPGSRPVKIAMAPPVSVMGLNVWEKNGNDTWSIGSFSGFYEWDTRTGRILDASTGKPADLKPGPPFGKMPVAGFLRNADGSIEPVRYDEGTGLLPQPDELAALPMPLYNVALEAHTGRLLFGPAATWFYVFLTGAAILMSLISGYLLHRRK